MHRRSGFWKECGQRTGADLREAEKKEDQTSQRILRSGGRGIQPEPIEIIGSSMILSVAVRCIDK